MIKYKTTDGINTYMGYFIIACVIIFSLSSMSIKSQEISTVGEIYDFEIGDVFHYRFLAYSPYGGEASYTNIEIINKSYSPNYETVYYTRDIAYYRSYPDPIIEYYIDEVSYDNLDSLIWDGNVDTVYIDSTIFNGRVINSVYWEFWHFDFVNGCGMANAYYSDGASVSSLEELIYFKKEGEEWGIPMPVSVKGISDDLSRFLVYPNPFTTSTTIEYELPEPSPVQLSIYNAIGEVVYMAEDCPMSVGKHSFTWTADPLPEGLYYAVLRSAEGVSVIKMIKQ